MSALDELVQVLREVVDNPLETTDSASRGGDTGGQGDGAAQSGVREKYQELLQRAVSLQK
ncbi:MAG: hypothetical protein J2P24_08415 [Streptosporangiales bacterium]|nr:hypothetical protein [Streptosporangiales bacterium]MBO0890389.1 hypothetical protein [Acidothermales bacterium]